MAKSKQTTVPIRIIEQSIFILRGKKVMLDKDLAALYGVKPIALRQQVKRNRNRFPADFMYQLTDDEVDAMLSQNVIPSKKSLGGHNPYVFTEQGVAMLSSVLTNPKAVEVNIAIMRTFVKLREILGSNELLRRKIESMERKYDEQFQFIFDTLKKMLAPPEPEPREPFGFRSRKKRQE